MKRLKSRLLARILAVATIFTALLCACTIGIFARYSSSVTGTDSARVAKFSVSAAPIGESDFSLTKGSDASFAEYLFSVTSESEVTVTYDVIVTLPDALPSGVSLTMAEATATVEGLVYTFPSVGRIKPDGEPKTHAIQITATEEAATGTLSNIHVKIVASQVQPS